VSLRARLTIGVVALAALGLLVAGAVTYAEQRSSLYDRIDQQVRGAIGAIGNELEDKGIRRRVPVPGAIGVPGAAQGADRPRGDRGPGDGPGAENLSSGLYGQARDASGRVLGEVRPRLPSGETAPADPKLPAKIRTDEPFTVGSVGSGGLRYRVVAQPFPDGGTTIAALPLTDVDATLSELLLIEGLVFSGVLLALGFGAWWIVRLGLRPLDAIAVTAGAIAAGDLTQRVDHAEPRTEVGRLGLSLNAMLARLEEAFAERRASEERLRRFLADASHELRTPLASIRGYAELFRIGAASEPEDVAKAMTRIEDESARMGVLVEDLLALARLDEVREQVREPVDLTQLAGDAVDDARAVAPEREISLHGGGEADAVVVDGDPGQLRQVLSNLMRNALVHTPAGTPIEVSVRTNGDGDAMLAVRDHGPGLPTDNPSELFDRFWRSDPGRGRGRAGAGLGLAIVAGVVAAHGGRASAADAADGGARFEVVLPLRSGAAR
jgi:two-component system OmpR family sensor kinase